MFHERFDRTLANPKGNPEPEGDPPDEQIPGGAEREQRGPTAVLEPKCSATSFPKIKVEHVTAADPVQYRPSSVASGSRTAVARQVVAAVPVVVPQREAIG